MSFTTVPVRTNGDTTVVADWWNALRTAGVALESWFGGGVIGETSFAIANGQAATDITGLSLDGAVYSSGRIDFEIHRTTASNEVMANGTLYLRYKGSTWEASVEWDGDAHGVTLTVDQTGSVGQAQYATDTLAGASYVGTLKFKATTWSA